MGAFTDRTALVTGATQGVGEALIRHLVAAGLSRAVITGRHRERGEALAEELRGAGCEVHLVLADLADAGAVAQLADESQRRCGVIDHLANCAGLTERSEIWTTTPEFFDRIMAVNVRAPLMLAQAVARMARAAAVPASIVNVGSIVAYAGPGFLTDYSISKGALLTLTKSLANQLAGYRIRVNLVNPGWTDTPGEHAIRTGYHREDDDWCARAETAQPFGRLIKPAELARTLAFVLSDEAGLMTGAVIEYDQHVIGVPTSAAAPGSPAVADGR